MPFSPQSSVRCNFPRVRLPSNRQFRFEIDHNLLQRFGNHLYCRPSYAATRAHQCMCQPAREICTRRYPTSLATWLFGSLGYWVENETGFLCVNAFDSPDFVQAAPHLVWNVMKQVVCVSSTSIHVLGCDPNTFVLVL